MSERYHVEIDGEAPFEVEILSSEDEGSAVVVRVDGVEYSVDLPAEPSGEGVSRSMLIDSRSHTVATQSSGDRLVVDLDGAVYSALVESDRDRRLASMQKHSGAKVGPSDVRCDMAGIVVRLAVNVGDVVAVGDPLIVVEAMKMENEIRAQAAGKVSAIHVAERGTVLAGDLLVTLAPAEEPAGE